MKKIPFYCRRDASYGLRASRRAGFNIAGYECTACSKLEARSSKLVARSLLRAPVILRQRLCHILPSHQDESLIFQEFLELRTLDHIEIMLPPGRAPIGMVECRAAHLIVVVGKVQDHLVNAGAEW